MSAQDTTRTARDESEHAVRWLAPGEGEARWVLGELDTVKASAAQTAGLFGCKESKAPKGSGPPLHVHAHEDEACYVLEGEVTFFVGDHVIHAATGSWIYLPRSIPHTLRIESEEARTLWLTVPGAFESFFLDSFPTAREGSSPPDEPVDFAQLAQAAARYGVTILGPPPEEKHSMSAGDSTMERKVQAAHAAYWLGPGEATEGSREDG
jgi:quercetin dioxygenase-like cupin family protein